MKIFFKTFFIPFAIVLLTANIFADKMISRENANKEANNFSFSSTFFPNAEAAWGISDAFLFNNYQSWPSSANRKAEDTQVQSLYLLYQTNSNSTLSDINGDGLADILYHLGTSTIQRYAILLNDGALGFNLVYKCVFYNSLWYGDCAG